MLNITFGFDVVAVPSEHLGQHHTEPSIPTIKTSRGFFTQRKVWINVHVVEVDRVTAAGDMVALQGELIRRVREFQRGFFQQKHYRAIQELPERMARPGDDVEYGDDGDKVVYKRAPERRQKQHEFAFSSPQRQRQKYIYRSHPSPADASSSWRATTAPHERNTQLMTTCTIHPPSSIPLPPLHEYSTAQLARVYSLWFPRSIPTLDDVLWEDHASASNLSHILMRKRYLLCNPHVDIDKLEWNTPQSQALTEQAKHCLLSELQRTFPTPELCLSTDQQRLQ